MTSAWIISLFVLMVLVFIPAFGEEKTGSLELLIKSENTDRVIPNSLSVKIFQDLKTTPLKELVLDSNPITISSLPLNHRYRIDVYMNSLYATTGFLDLTKPQNQIDLTIENTGGMRLTVYYSDGQTPLPNAMVWIKSYDGKTWSYSETDEQGQTLRAWLYPTIREGDFYYAEISLGPNLKYQTQLKLVPDIAQEFKVVTKWPVVIDKSFKVEVYNNTKNKVSKQDGKFIIQLLDSKKNKIAESDVSVRGDAYLSKLKVGNYGLFVKSKDLAGNLITVVGKRITVTDSLDTVKIYLHNPELNDDHLNCNCVAFRLDDVQDYYLSATQQAIMSKFQQKNVPLTIGVIGSVIGTDPKLVSVIKNGLEQGNLEIANHSWHHDNYKKMTKSEQEIDLKNTNKKISELFGVEPKTFIPPQNLFNNDTLALLKTNGFTHISPGEIGIVDDPPKFKKSKFYYFPMFAYTGRLNPDTDRWDVSPNDQVFARIEDSIFNYGYAVVMMHSNEFSALENGVYANKVNNTRLDQLDALLDKIQSEKISITTIGSIQDYDLPHPIKTQQAPKQIQEIKVPTCNCIAFRLDNVQDFYLNDVQNSIIETFDKNKADFTITAIGKFLGDDPKVVKTLKQKLENGSSKILFAHRGWEYVDHTAFDKEKQAASIRQTNEKLGKLFNKTPILFAPPIDSFNNNTLDAMKQEHMVYLSVIVSKDKPNFDDVGLRHVPITNSFSNLLGVDPFVLGTDNERALIKLDVDLKKYGYSAISLQSQDFAIKQDIYVNQINQTKIQSLDSLIKSIKSKGIRIVTIDKIPALTESKVIVPDWVKSNAGWWAENKISDSDFVKGIQYLIKQKIIKVSSVTPETKTQKIPDWVKSNAGWWAENKISDSDFVKGIQYLIQNGIIMV